MVLIINLVLGLTAVLAILATSNMKMDDVLFEVYSAISTVGMTTGITKGFEYSRTHNYHNYDVLWKNRKHDICAFVCA